jgi:hypothetical protein
MYYHCAGHIRKCPWPWALPYYKYYLCVGPIRGFGNALDCGPYPTTCTILVQDPLEGLEMSLTLALTYMYYPWVGLEMPLTLGPYPTSSTIFVQDPLEGFRNAFDLRPYPTTCTILVWDWKCSQLWALPYYMYYPCARPSRGFGDAFNLGPYPTTSTILVWDRKCSQPWALPYYPCAGPIRGFCNALDLGPW